MLKLETKADLDRLISESIAERLTLDYKGSAALATDSKSRDEFCKDVSAFANSAGGQIVYGIEEEKNVPSKVDDRADPSITKEWIEQVLDSRIHPRIEGLIITPIKLAKASDSFSLFPKRHRALPISRPTRSTISARTFSRYQWRTMKFAIRCAEPRRRSCKLCSALERITRRSYNSRLNKKSLGLSPSRCS